MLPSKAFIAPCILLLFTDIRSPGFSKLFRNKSIDEFDRVIELKPNFGMAYFIQGQIYLKKEEFDKAIDDYNKVIELNPNDATAYHDRGLAYK
jgi:tetratricopeptide (TPR) repeat protein